MKQPRANSFDLPDNTIIEVIRTKGDEVVKKDMTFREWKELKKQPGYTYSAFQKGYSQFKIDNDEKI